MPSSYVTVSGRNSNGSGRWVVGRWVEKNVGCTEGLFKVSVAVAQGNTRTQLGVNQAAE